MKSSDKNASGYNEKNPSEPQGSINPDNAKSSSLKEKPKKEKAPVAEKKLKRRKGQE